MRNKLILIVLVGFLTLLGGCKALKHKTWLSQKNASAEKTTSVASTLKLDSTFIQNAIKKQGIESSYSEELTIKNHDVLKDIEISANFKIDTSSILTGDTVLKLIDIKNGNTSLTIYQNRKTNQLMAKVKSPEGNSNTNFSEISLKKTFSNKNTSETDSSTTQFAKKEQTTDSLILEKTNSEEKTERTKHKETIPSFLIWGLAIAAACALIYFIIKLKR